MLFSETSFLFYFLPVVLAVYFLPWKGHRNLWLVLASLFFYAWGEKVGLMLLSIALNFLMGLWVGRTRERPVGRWVLGLGVVLNLGLLISLKYANFLGDNLNGVRSLLGLSPLAFTHVALPVGISFLTFHGMSYVIDVYRGDAPTNKSPLEAALYLSLFPQLIAGPIVRYRHIADQIRHRDVDAEGFAEGIHRFVLGLAKKMLLANTLAEAADQIFALAPGTISSPVAWLGAVTYTLQIYFDFSGYSDMAIGLARMFGFRFLENFNFPYISRSITEFWRRWHISLSSWFRDYLYIPLGGNRKGPARTYLNLVTVFFLCGLWHGASWTFVVWGLYHGVFLVLERLGWGDFLERRPAVLGHAYTLLVAVVGWVFFRADSLAQALGVLKAMAGLGAGMAEATPLAAFLTPRLVLTLIVAPVCATPILSALGRWKEGLPEGRKLAAEGLGLVGMGALFLLCAMMMAAGTYNPFIYYKF